MAIADKLTLIAENMQKVYDAGVSVIPGGYIKPSGSLDITENNTYDVKQYESVNVNVESSGGDLTINGVIEQYKVNAGATVNAGDFVEFVEKVGWGSGEFNTGNSNYISACKLTDTKVLVAYQDEGNSNYGTAVVLSLENGVVTVGTETVFKNSAATRISAVALSDSKVLVVYCYGTSTENRYARAVVLTINNTIITVGTETVIKSARIDYISAVALTDSKVLVAYSVNQATGRATVLSISDTSISVGTEITFKSVNTVYISACKLSNTKVLVVYGDVGNSYYGTAVVLTINNTIITVGTEIVIKSARVEDISAVALTDSKVLVAYKNYSNSSSGNAIILTINETTISVGTETVFTPRAYNIFACRLTGSKVLVAYQNYGNTYYGMAVVLTIDDTTITTGTEIIFNPSVIYNYIYYPLVVFSENSVLIAYNNGAGIYKGLTINDTTITESTEAQAETLVQPATSRLYNVGVAKTGGVGGETVEVYCVEEPEPAPTPKQITVTFAGDSYMNVIHNNTTYYNASSFTAMTGDEIGFFNDTGSMYMALYVNGENIGELTSQDTIYWTIPFEATSVNIAEGVYEYGYNNYDITYTTD